jgi:hypothetical protein
MTFCIKYVAIALSKTCKKVKISKIDYYKKDKISLDDSIQFNTKLDAENIFKNKFLIAEKHFNDLQHILFPVYK